MRMGSINSRSRQQVKLLSLAEPGALQVFYSMMKNSVMLIITLSDLSRGVHHHHHENQDHFFEVAPEGMNVYRNIEAVT